MFVSDYKTFKIKSRVFVWSIPWLVIGENRDGGNSFIFILFLFENSFILLGNSFILEY
jgi:hypothetical protein